jgi:hypothetical protein
MATRKMGPEGQGSSGDIRDRFRDVYKPGKNKPVGGFGNPVKQVGDLLRRIKPGPKKKTK